MDPIPVFVKHQGKKHELELDPTSDGSTFKFQLYSLTGVEPERQKVLIKGGQLKDDTPLSSLNVKPGHTFMMMGTPSGNAPVIEKPKEAVKFLEDMTEAEVAQQEGATPAGLQNLGNTCYMNSTLQVLRAIPELQEELLRYSTSGSSSSGTLSADARAMAQQMGVSFGGDSSDLTASLRDLLRQMSQTQEGFPPILFLQALRNNFPQFAQRARDGRGYAQQDAEEAWSQIVSTLRQKLKAKEKINGQEREVSWIDTFMAGKFSSIMECDDPAAKEAGEEPVHSTEEFFKLNCHMSAETNHLVEGIRAGLKEQIEKKSAVLDRDTSYTKTSKITRLPKYLPVHFMRFDWRRSTNKKAKIMRKVTFPRELDVVEFCDDSLKPKLIPIRDKIRDIRKEEEDVERAKKRQKRMREGEENDLPTTTPASDSKAGAKGKESASASAKDKERATKATGPASEKELVKEKKAGSGSGDVEMEDVVYKTDAEIDEERAASILFAKTELLNLVDKKLAEDIGANQTGLYELRGVVTHQGASADSGHYTAFIKKEGAKDANGKRKQEDGKWWWFNDDKVSEVDAERVDGLSGGGQSHSALILLYRAVPLPSLEDVLAGWDNALEFERQRIKDLVTEAKVFMSNYAAGVEDNDAAGQKDE